MSDPGVEGVRRKLRTRSASRLAEVHTISARAGVRMRGCRQMPVRRTGHLAPVGVF